MTKIGLSGFGRIGRAITRIVSNDNGCEIVAINEIDPDIDNIAYLLKYDSIYGRCDCDVSADSVAGTITCDGHPIKIYSSSDPTDVPWENHGVDVLIDATGVNANVAKIRTMIGKRVKKAIVTNANPEVDFTIICGVNEESYCPQAHDIVSSSICDSNAISPVLSEIDKVWGIENCFITTLHPWLSYQNLLDGYVSSVASPGHFWKDYSLGRASMMSLIPKDTTAAKATLAVMPHLSGRLDAMSFRVPTHMVSASDMTIMVKGETTAEAVNEHFAGLSKTRSGIFGYEEDHLVSIDYLKTSNSMVVDARRTKVLNSRMIKMVVWYDNEWGYSSRVVDIAKLLKVKG